MDISSLGITGVAAITVICLLIDRGRTDGLQEKMDVYLAADRLTPEEYSALSKMLTAEAAE